MGGWWVGGGVAGGGGWWVVVVVVVVVGGGGGWVGRWGGHAARCCTARQLHTRVETRLAARCTHAYRRHPSQQTPQRAAAAAAVQPVSSTQKRGCRMQQETSRPLYHRGGRRQGGAPPAARVGAPCMCNTRGCCLAACSSCTPAPPCSGTRGTAFWASKRGHGRDRRAGGRTGE